MSIIKAVKNINQAKNNSLYCHAVHLSESSREESTVNSR